MQPHGGSASKGGSGGDALTPTRGGAHDMLETVLDCLEDAKAEDIVSIDLDTKSSIADYMIVSSGRSQRHVGAIADQLLSKLKGDGFGRARVEGLPNCDWVLIDAGDILVHIFRPEVRNFYNLEKLWSSKSPSDMIAV